MRERKQMEKWQSDIEDWREIPLALHKFCYDEGRNRLEALISTGIQITTRAYSVIGFLIPVMAVCLAVILEASKHPISWNVIASSFCLITALICLFMLYKVIAGRKGYEIGIEPKQIYNREQMSFTQTKTDDEKLKLAYYNEMAQLQEKISKLTLSNKQRTTRLQYAIFIFFISTVVMILHVVSIVIF